MNGMHTHQTIHEIEVTGRLDLQSTASLFQTGLNGVPFGLTPWTVKDSK